MPPQGHNTAPQSTTDVARELQRYFQELELLFIIALIVSDIKKKLQTCCYVNIDTADL
jgi:hypothetical protein